jgi:acyl carrier protein
VEVELQTELCELLDSALSLGGRGLRLKPESKLFGALPELDSVGVVSVLTALEDRFSIAVEDDEISADTFATMGSFVAFVASKIES